jgi:hypothetical protein
MSSGNLSMRTNETFHPHCVSKDGLVLLQRAMAVGRSWLKLSATQEMQRGNVIYMLVLAERLIRDADCTSHTFSKVSGLFCAGCLSLNAAQGQCAGQPLDQCPLLNGANP